MIAGSVCRAALFDACRLGSSPLLSAEAARRKIAQQSRLPPLPFRIVFSDTPHFDFSMQAETNVSMANGNASTQDTATTAGSAEGSLAVSQSAGGSYANDSRVATNVVSGVQVRQGGKLYLREFHCMEDNHVCDCIQTGRERRLAGSSLTHWLHRDPSPHAPSAPPPSSWPAAARSLPGGTLHHCRLWTQPN